MYVADHTCICMISHTPFLQQSTTMSRYNDQLTSCKSPLDFNTAQIFFSPATVAIITCFSYKTSTKRFQLIYGFVLRVYGVIRCRGDAP